MNFFTPQTMVVRIDVENSVTVRRPTVIERNECFAIAEVAARGQTISMGLTLQQELLKRVVVAWDGPAFDGRAPTPENVDALPAHVADMVVEKASDFMGGLSDAEKKASGAPASA